MKIQVKGLDGLQDYFERLPEVASQAAALAINDIAGGTGLTMLRRATYEEIDFPKGYLTAERLGLKSRATPTRLEAVVRGRDRPTSLARFAANGQTPQNTRKVGVRVTVKGGRTRVLRKSWLVNLRNGNLGLAVRVRPGERLEHSEGAVRLSDNVYLLYGPSVDQVFGDVAWDHRTELSSMVASEFLRQFARLTRG